MASNVNFSAVVYAIFVFNTHPINRISKTGAAIVNTISSFEIEWGSHFSQFLKNNKNEIGRVKKM